MKDRTVTESANGQTFSVNLRQTKQVYTITEQEKTSTPCRISLS